MTIVTDFERAEAASRFAERWEGRGYEKGEGQVFWTTLLTDVFGVKDVESFINFEMRVKKEDTTNFIDA